MYFPDYILQEKAKLGKYFVISFSFSKLLSKILPIYIEISRLQFLEELLSSNGLMSEGYNLNSKAFIG